ncbi:hypothetical protein FA740_17140 [Paracoccus hibiscisoli]|uniref:Uncharacterized protein n=1 Tax=Paracoccus hibiscisoli TaxID=2023261 RepID=A0A4U0QG83_9RHOB|nr:hypothetical protein FA740_17140 [Paracoccus hibiscisoli]
MSAAKPEVIAQGKALLSINCKQYIEAQGFDAGKLLGIIAAKHLANETISYKEVYETCHRRNGKWGKEIGMAAARFCTGAASIWGWANGHPGMNDAVVNAHTKKRGDGAAAMDYLKD